MSALKVRPFLLILIVSAAAVAQQPPYLPTNTADANQLLADRVRFVKEMYTLDSAAQEKLNKELTGLVPFHEKYMKDASKTSYRLELAMSIVNNDSQTPEAERPAKLNRFRTQLAELYAKAPLSLANVMKMADAASKPGQAEMAHAKVAARLSEQLHGQPLVIANVDSLLMPPIKNGAPLPVIAAATPPPAPVQPVQLNPQPSPNPNPQPATPQAPPVKVTPPQPALPPPPPRVIAPAPSIEVWKTNIEATMTKYEFTPEQKKVADRVLDQCKLRAETAKTKARPDAEEAAKISDEKARASKMSEINKPVDMAYDELVQRVEAIATAEQRAKAEKKQPAGK